MKKTRIGPKKYIINIYLFTIGYFSLVLFLRKLEQSSLLSTYLPFQPELNEYILFGFIGVIITILGTRISKNKPHLIRIALLSVFLLGTIGINGFNIKLNYPPYVKTDTGDIFKLGKKRWPRELPYQLYEVAYQQYPLSEITMNPNLDNFTEYSRLYRFGIYINKSDNAPIELSQLEYELIQSENIPIYIVSSDAVDYILYKNSPDNKLLLTTYLDKILIIPYQWINR